MLFQKEHIAMIADGTKTETRRIWDGWHAKVGGTYAVQSRRYQPRSECIIIACTNRYTQRLGDMTEENARAEGGYTLAQFKALWERINRVPWDDNQIVHVVVFQRVHKSMNPAVHCVHCTYMPHAKFLKVSPKITCQHPQPIPPYPSCCTCGGKRPQCQGHNKRPAYNGDSRHCKLRAQYRYRPDGKVYCKRHAVRLGINQNRENWEAL